MIPDIHAIVEMLIAGQCTAQQALGWLNTHMENADLRDHFAGLAMAAIISKNGLEITDDSVTPKVLRVTRGAYDYADAMLKARQA